MAKIKLQFDAEPFTGQIVTFTAPCACEDATGGLVINGSTYTVVDAMGNAITGGGAWCNGALVSVSLDVTNRRAYFQNAATLKHTHEKSEITDFPATMPPSKHNHSASDIDSGTLAVARGGTGNTSVDDKPTKNSSKMVTSGGVFNALAEKAESSHGNHVPATETANNARFLRNDNTWQAVTPANIGAAKVSTVVAATLTAASWTGTAAPYTYELTVNGVTATSNQELLPAVDITTEQLEALQGANIQDGGQAANKITLKAYGDKPTIDLPIRVIMRGD